MLPRLDEGDLYSEALTIIEWPSIIKTCIKTMIGCGNFGGTMKTLWSPSWRVPDHSAEAS